MTLHQEKSRPTSHLYSFTTLLYFSQFASYILIVTRIFLSFLYFEIGTLMDMKKVRLATQAELGAERPAILRKDFILDRYVLGSVV
jgi:hypothetical protein